MGMSVIPDNKGCTPLTCNVPPFLGGTDPSNTLCPVSHLKLSNPSVPFHSLDQVDGCVSDCTLYGGAVNCCKGKWDDANKCPANSAWFKQACPDAYSYAHSDEAIKTCGLSDITISFSCSKG